LGVLLPALCSENALFKVPSSIKNLMHINAGSRHGYCQVGKFLTVYPTSEAQFATLVPHFYELTKHFNAPLIPFDFQFRKRGIVFYRYGAFRRRQVRSDTGAEIPVILAPSGETIRDRRYEAYIPSWTNDPFQTDRPESNTRIGPNLLKSRYHVFEAISQRGKGGVYRALDFHSLGFVILKEGRTAGEVGFDGSDGRTRVRNEKLALTDLRRGGVPVPAVLADFELGGNTYLVLEDVAGTTLQMAAESRTRRMPVREIIKIGIQMAEIVGGMHRAGWVWRDCKPANIIVTGTGKLRPLDFEGACRVGDSTFRTWATPQYAPPEAFDPHSDGKSKVPEDLFALGAVMHFLVEGTAPGFRSSTSTSRRPRGRVPKQLLELISALMDPLPDRRPGTRTVIDRLEAVA
jgi:hypothetical protein